MYGWIIDEDHLEEEDGRKGVMGPRAIPEAIEAKLKAGEGLLWRCLDDDGIVYYSGRFLDDDEEQFEQPREAKCGGCIGNLSEEAFGPLWDFCQPDSGAVSIEYLTPDTTVKGKWLEL
jgi:hypothetical protein